MDFRHWFLKYSWVVNLALLAGIALVSARTINAYVSDRYLGEKQAPEVRNVHIMNRPAPYRPNLGAIIKRDLFDAVEDEMEFSSGATDGDTTDLKDTSLRLKLLGAAYYGPGSESNLATITQLKDQKTGVYLVGMTVEGATVDEIEYDRVILAHNGALEVLRLEEEKLGKGKKGQGRGPREALEASDPRKRAEAARERQKRAMISRRGGDADKFAGRVKQVGDNEYLIEKAAMDEALADLNSIITQARVIPNFTGQGTDRMVDGFRIYRIQPGSIYEYLGLKNGDVLKSINGEPMDSVETGLKLFESLRNESKFNVAIERQKQPMEMSYEVQ